MKVLEQQTTRQPGHLAIERLKVAGEWGIGVVEPLEVVEAWPERLGALATPKGQFDDFDYGATTPVRRNRKGIFEASKTSRRNKLPA